MKSLDKPIRRRTMTAHGVAGGRRLVVILEPGDILAMREERRRTVYRASLGWVFIQLARRHALLEAERKRQERALKRKGGLK